jgi:uncharacterized protein YegJ (DUF2314 family)
MNMAIAKARFNLPRFDSALANGKYDKNLYMLKVRFPTPSGGGEHMWLAVITKVNGHYRGIVTDSAYEATQIHEGDILMINDADITDWMFGTKAVIHGAYTTRVILSRMTPEERAAHDRVYRSRIED